MNTNKTINTELINKQLHLTTTNYKKRNVVKNSCLFSAVVGFKYLIFTV